MKKSAVGPSTSRNHWLLLPLSWVYGIVVNLRNLLFNIGVLQQKSFSVPVIGVGNITVGGTGKTPHTEYLIRLLSKQLQVAVLSRGYKRKSKGYVLAQKDTPMSELGDEPYQMKRKFPQVHVAVCKKRVEGIERLMHDKATESTDVILLDDAFQHRYVKPHINILLIDFNRFITKDHLLPVGRLREPSSGIRRADIVIITKCPTNLRPIDYRTHTKSLKLMAFQKIFFTALQYGDLVPLFRTEKTPVKLEALGQDEHLLLLTGIATPQKLENDLRPYCGNIRTLAYPDHHFFTAKDAKHINSVFQSMPEPRRIITTEKDATRLELLNNLSEEVRQNIYTLPVEIKFLLNQEEQFNKIIVGYIQKNSKNSTLNQHKTRNSAPAATKPKKEPEKPQTITFR